MDNIKNELYSLLLKSLSIGVPILFYFILYKFCYKTMLKIFSRFGGVDVDDYEKYPKQSFGVFAFNCFLLTIGVSAIIAFIGFVIFFWYYSTPIITLILILCFDRDVKFINYIKGLFFLLLIIFLITMYQYRNSFLHG